MRSVYESLYKYISSQVGISDEEFTKVEKAFTPKKLRRRQYLLQEGDVCRFVAFVVKGILRQYHIDDKGNEHITQFAMEDWWISDRESLTNQTPSIYFIDALEASVVLLITKENLSELEQNIPSFRDLMSTIKERRAFAGQKRIMSAISYSARQKYKLFIETYPALVQRIPQHMIASYLGITPETISRLRSKPPQD